MRTRPLVFLLRGGPYDGQSRHVAQTAKELEIRGRDGKTHLYVRLPVNGDGTQGAVGLLAIATYRGTRRR